MRQLRYHLATIPGAAIGVRNVAMQADHPFERAAFAPVSAEEYGNTVLDWRFEDSERTQ